MSTAATILGLIGGIIGLFMAGVALVFGGIAAIVDPNTATYQYVVFGGWTALAASAVGIVGASLSKPRPRLGALLMFLAALAGTIGVSLAYVIAGPLLLTGAILGLIANLQHRGTGSEAPLANA
jgi:hypothetical protein